MMRRPVRFSIPLVASITAISVPSLIRDGVAADAPPEPPIVRSATVDEAPPVPIDDVKAAIRKALPPIETGAAGHLRQRSCFACHNLTLPVLALRTARDRDFEIDGDGFDKQLDRTHAVLSRWAKSNTDRKNFIGGQADTAGYALWALELGERPPDDTTAAVVEYLLNRDESRGYWRSSHADRPPSEASSFTTTAWAVRGINHFGTPEQQERITARTRAARDWLLRTKPADTEDRVFRLWGLNYAAAEPEQLAAAVEDLLAAQREDGGWAQLEDMPSDAYATGTALVALHRAGGLATDGPAYRRGMKFLLANQREDGTWFVPSRSENRFQAQFDSGFPYEKDQWISIAASSWSTAALALAVGD
ncbi:MAG: prenyltransferase/squalene oxidase repeat-containing protein [Planctomycetaceae bacterium]